MNRIRAWCVAWLFRWFTHAAPAGLRKVGDPDENSPVLVTGNFSLTLRRVLRGLGGTDAWLLVASSGGINVWCASCGGRLTHEQVIDAVKVSQLARKVAHRRLVLPALCAPGVDRTVVEERTGFHCRFGPVHARDLREYLRRGMLKTEAMRRADFGLRHRLDVLIPMNFIIFLAGAAVLGIFWPEYLLGGSVLFWASAAFLYLFLDWIPGRTGWAQALLAAGVAIAAWAGLDTIRYGDPLRHAGWLLAVAGVMFAVGFDLAGIASPRPSDAEALVDRLPFRRVGALYSERGRGRITLDRGLCRGCQGCWDICPVGVYGGLGPDHKTTFRDRAACFRCGACVLQCPEQALSLKPAPESSLA